MRDSYGVWACPTPGCPKIAISEVKCPDHSVKMVRTVLTRRAGDKGGWWVRVTRRLLRVR